MSYLPFFAFFAARFSLMLFLGFCFLSFMLLPRSFVPTSPSVVGDLPAATVARSVDES